MKKHIRLKISFILLWAFLIVSFTTLAVFVLYEANGYRLDKTTMKLEQTGLVAIDGLPKQVNIDVNNTRMKDVLPFKMSKALPGTYVVKISKDGYSNWTKTIKVIGGQAIDFKKVYLYITNPQIIESNRNTNAEAIKNDAKNEANDLLIINNEIWYKKLLVTRFSDTPKSAILTDDREHIIFQLGKELRVIELDGANNTKLFDFPTNDPYVFAMYQDKIVYAANDKIYEAKIR
ncbi:MAG: PEGA domain-containing protein [Candidatus Berkelbacteria bacterium]